MLCWFLLLGFHMTQIWWRSGFRVRGNNFLQRVLSHSDCDSKPDCSLHRPEVEIPGWNCEHVKGTCICASALHCSTFPGEKGEETLSYQQKCKCCVTYGSVGASPLVTIHISKLIFASGKKFKNCTLVSLGYCTTGFGHDFQGFWRTF